MTVNFLFFSLAITYLMLIIAADDRDDWSYDYPISDRYKEHWDKILRSWRPSPLVVYDSKNVFVNPGDLELSLRGSLVLVYFQMRHYEIQGKDKKINGNTFTATVIQIKVLEEGKKNRPSYKAQLLKGPVTLPQSPRKKKDQLAAVNAFHAHGAGPTNYGTSTVSGSSEGAPNAANMSVSEGKKRMREGDGTDDTMPSDGEVSGTGVTKRKKKQNK
jgi:hypothetical protein